MTTVSEYYQVVTETKVIGNSVSMTKITPDKNKNKSQKNKCSYTGTVFVLQYMMMSIGVRSPVVFHALSMRGLFPATTKKGTSILSRISLVNHAFIELLKPFTL